MLPHLSTRPPRRRWSQRIGWWRDLSEWLIRRGVPSEGDLVVEIDVCVAVDDIEPPAWMLSASP